MEQLSLESPLRRRHDSPAAHENSYELPSVTQPDFFMPPNNGNNNLNSNQNTTQSNSQPMSIGTPFTMIPFPDIDEISIASTEKTSGTTVEMSEWRTWLYHLAYKKDTKASRVLYYCIVTVILISIVTLSLSTVHEYQSGPINSVLFTIDTICIIIFTLELIMNTVAAPTFKHLFTVWYFIDVFAVVPFYIELIVIISQRRNALTANAESIGGIRILRLFRVFRIFKFFKRSARLRIVGKAVKDSLEGFLILIFSLFILIIFYATLQFYAEQSGSVLEDGVWVYTRTREETPFQSIPSILFTTLVTLTGNPPDNSLPGTAAGQIVMGMTVITFLFVIAFPLTMISMSYSKAVRFYSEQSILKKEERRRKKRHHTRTSVASMSAAISPMGPGGGSGGGEVVDPLPTVIESDSESPTNPSSNTLPDSFTENADLNKDFPDLIIAPSAEPAKAPESTRGKLWGKVKGAVEAKSLPNVVKAAVEARSLQTAATASSSTILDMERGIVTQMSPQTKKPGFLKRNTTMNTASSGSQDFSQIPAQQGTLPVKRPKAGSLIGSSATNLTEVNLRVVDWEYRRGSLKVPKQPKKAGRPTSKPGTIEHLHLDDSDDEDLDYEAIGNKYGWDGGDKLQLKVAVKNEQQFKKLLKVLAEFE